MRQWCCLTLSRLWYCGMLWGLLGGGCTTTTQEVAKGFDSTDWVGRISETTTKHKSGGSLTNTVTAPFQEERQNGDMVFNQGVFVEQFEENALVATLKADTAVFLKKQALYQAYGNVVVCNFKRADTLYTSLLNWSIEDQSIHTDRFIEIKQNGQWLQGYGLHSTANLKEYRILKPTGTVQIP